MLMIQHLLLKEMHGSKSHNLLTSAATHNKWTENKISSSQNVTTLKNTTHEMCPYDS